MPIISVIIPVYNAEDYLERCIESVLRQSFLDYEVLLIDDGSTDSSIDICNYYAKSNARICAYHKENAGVSSARNLGLQHAKGKWIAFIDSDDWVDPFYLEHLIGHTTDDIDLVFSYATIFFNDGKFLRETFPIKNISSDEIESAFVENELHGHTAPWSKLYRRELIEKIELRYCEGMHIGEDAVFLYSYILHCRNLYISNDADYFYSFETADSLTKRVNSLESELMGYYKITDIIQTLCVCKNVKDLTALSKLDWMKGYYVRRVLNALYHNGNISRAKRMEIVKKIDLRPYLEAVNIPAPKERILSFLLKCRLVYVYDMLRVVARYI